MSGHPPPFLFGLSVSPLVCVGCARFLDTTCPTGMIESALMLYLYVVLWTGDCVRACVTSPMCAQWKRPCDAKILHRCGHFLNNPSTTPCMCFGAGVAFTRVSLATMIAQQRLYKVKLPDGPARVEGRDVMNACSTALHALLLLPRSKPRLRHRLSCTTWKPCSRDQHTLIQILTEQGSCSLGEGVAKAGCGFRCKGEHPCLLSVVTLG